MRRALLATLGVICLALGIAGIFLPGVPTTEFVIAASYLFARSAPSLNRWLEETPWAGPSLRRFRETRGMPRRSKIVALVSMWTGISVSLCTLADAGMSLQALVVALGLIGTITMLCVVRTVAPRQPLILS